MANEIFYMLFFTPTLLSPVCMLVLLAAYLSLDKPHFTCSVATWTGGYPMAQHTVEYMEKTQC